MRAEELKITSVTWHANDYANMTVTNTGANSLTISNALVDDVAKTWSVYSPGTNILAKGASATDYAAQLFLQQKFPLVFKSFDIMRLNGIDLTRKPYWERKNALKRLVKAAKTETIQYVPFRWDLPEFFEETKRMDEEGIIIKDKNSPYEFNTRAWSWMKVKNWRQVVCHVVGFTPGENSRSFFFGSLVLEKDGKYIGCAGSGFNDWELRHVKDILTDSPKTSPPFDIGEQYTPVKTDMQVQVQYYKITKTGVMREPCFQRIME